MAQDLRSFLEIIEREYPEQLVRVREEVSAVFEATALVLEAEKLPSCPVVRFEHVKGSDFPLVSNLLAHRPRLALALGVPGERLVEEFGARLKNSIPPVVRNDAPFQENVVLGDSVDLSQLPILTHFEQDGGPYLTAGLLVARDPYSGISTIGYHRMQLKEPRKLGVSLHSRRRMFEYFRRAEEKGHPLEVAACIGVHPLLSLGALSLPPANVEKFEVLSGLFGEPVELARCRTVDLLVPRWSEIVIEGRILNGVREKEGPFGEFTGYASSRGTENVFVATALLYRSGALYQDINAGNSIEHCRCLSLPREVEFTNVLSKSIPNLKAVHVPVRSGIGSFVCYVSLRKTAEGQGKQAIFSVLGADHYVKLVVVVDDDIDVFDEERVLWAMATRMQADRDVFITSGGMGTLLDPSSKDAITAKMGIDATRPLGDFPKTLSLSQQAIERARSLLKSATAGSNVTARD
ncbi:MAG: UbiD family decarboxylase [Deltaproteobacteria bacterium]|nr:UbiD family decarboxylase [Deltaproteobacteria bacterium]